MPDGLNIIQRAIDQHDCRLLSLTMFEELKGIPTLRMGFGHERRIWDFKSEIPSVRKDDRGLWAGIAADVLAFHNANGGALIFGIRDHDFSFSGCNEHIDTKSFNDKIRYYLGDRFYVTFSREFIQPDQKYLGIAIIPQRKNEYIRFRREYAKPNGEIYFSKGDIAIREGDETKILRGRESTKFLVNRGQSIVGTLLELTRLVTEYLPLIIRSLCIGKIIVNQY